MATNSNSQERRALMLETPMLRLVPKIAVPMIISALIDSIYNLADTFFVSGLGQTATAAVAINDSLMNIIRAVGMGFAMGASSYISRLMGAGKNDKATRVAATTLYIGCLFSSVLAALAFIGKSDIVLWLGSTAESQQYSVDYATWILIATPFTIANTILNQLLRSEGSSMLAMVGMSSGCVLNCLLDPVFISVLGMEVKGAALATAISKVFSFCILLYPYAARKAVLSVAPKHFKVESDAVKEVARMGVPTFLRMALMSTGAILTNNVAKGFGTSVLAGIAIANKLSRFVASAIMGFSQGIAPIGGFCWGARRYKRVKETFKVTFGIECAVAIVLGALSIIFAEPIVGLFNSEADPTVLRIACLKLRTLSITLIPHCLVMATSNLYQAIGRPVENLILSMSRQLICFIPLVIILSRFFGAEGLACAQATADFVSGFLMALPLVLSLFRKLDKLNDGDEPPFGRTV